MTSEFKHDYLPITSKDSSVKTLCKRWGLTVQQIQYLAEKHNMRLWVYLRSKKEKIEIADILLLGNNRPDLIRIYERPRADTKLSAETLKILLETPDDELKKEGFTIYEESDADVYIDSSGNIEKVDSFFREEDGAYFEKIYLNGVLRPERSISPAPNPKMKTPRGWNVPHDGYIEYTFDHAFDTPWEQYRNQCLSDIFSGQPFCMFFVACDNPNNFRYLDKQQQPSLDDVYIHTAEVTRIEELISIEKGSDKEQYLKKIIEPAVKAEKRQFPTHSIETILKKLMRKPEILLKLEGFNINSVDTLRQWFNRHGDFKHRKTKKPSKV